MSGVNGEKLHAKYIRPKSMEKVPVVLQFHGYPGASRGWFEQASFAGMGMAVLAMDCPGQGGSSEDLGAERELQLLIILFRAWMEMRKRCIMSKCLWTPA
ncbi:MAG: acetylxylan esterase [Suilimivivens sp.]